ncbi:uncharacterized protein YALI1_C01694g [Yarrowia lipolytica]|uniref:Uncharacterized protein n=1 Tax=Yarrowia lipolytica TaxID=4952 RepID=A0A1D8N979_YARLL|nr:hypothetical protein YALI1_C01694g [Yarrowia lipolytica]
MCMEGVCTLSVNRNHFWSYLYWCREGAPAEVWVCNSVSTSTVQYLVEEIVPRLTHASQLISMETVGTASATETVVWVDCIMSLNLWVSQDAERQKVWKHGQCTVGVCRRLWSIRQQLGSVPRMFFAKTSLSGNMWTQPKQTAVDLWA